MTLEDKVHAFRLHVLRRANELGNVSDACSGCGVCAQVCPVNNIEIVDGKPMWNHRCENCLACFNGCPINAIGGGIASNKYRYCHPNVTLPDIAGQSEPLI